MTVRHIPGLGLINTRNILLLGDIGRWVDSDGIPQASFYFQGKGGGGGLNSWPVGSGISITQVEQVHRDLTDAMLAENEKP